MATAIGLNFCVNALLLIGTSQLAGREAKLLRTALAAAIGAAYAGLCMQLPWLGVWPWRVLCMAAMSGLAFGRNRQAWKLGGIYALLSVSLGSAVLAAGRGGLWQLPLCALGIHLLNRCPPERRRLLPVEIPGDGSIVRLTALRDTGNELRDPISGESVLVVGLAPSSRLTGLTAEQLRDPLKTLTGAPLSGLRLIPFQSVGREDGLLLAKRFPAVRIGRTVRPTLVAFAPQTFGGKEYQALAGGIF